MNLDLDVNSKQSIRKELLAKRKYFNQALYQEANDAIYKNLIELISRFSGLDEIESTNIDIGTIGLYWSIQGEPESLKLALSTKSRISLPKILKSEMIFVECNDLNLIETSTFPAYITQNLRVK